MKLKIKSIVMILLYIFAAILMMKTCVFSSYANVLNGNLKLYPTLISPIREDKEFLLKKIEENNTVFFKLTDEERKIIENIVTGEAGNQEYWGKVGVASCILNACIKDNISPMEVRIKYQYSGWKDLNEFENECLKAYGNTKLADEVRQAVEQVFDNGEVLNSSILWFYNPKYGYSNFHESQQHIITIGDHKFFAPN